MFTSNLCRPRCIYLQQGQPKTFTFKYRIYLFITKRRHLGGALLPPQEICFWFLVKLNTFLEEKDRTLLKIVLLLSNITSTSLWTIQIKKQILISYFKRVLFSFPSYEINNSKSDMSQPERKIREKN